MRETKMKECKAGGKHEKLIIPVNENRFQPLDNSYNLMQWDDNSIKVNMCTKCHLLYWEEIHS